jgi:polar amino acid transport system substrate-binding protein
MPGPRHNRLTLLRLAQASLLLACGIATTAASAPLVFAFSELPPWKTLESRHFGGAYTEIVRELAKRTGKELEIILCPIKRCLRMIEDGQADVIIGIQTSPERDAYIHFLHTPYRKFSSDKVFYVLKGKAATIRSYNDLTKLRIGVKNGTQYFDRFDDDTQLTKDGAKDAEANFKKLLRGRVDTVVMAEDQGESFLYSLHLKDYLEKAEYREADRTPRSVGFSKKSTHITHLPKLEAAMTAMVKDGTVRALFKRYYFDAYHVPRDSFPIE